MSIHSIVQKLKGASIGPNDFFGDPLQSGKRIAWGSAVPSAVSGYAKGCMFVDTDDGVVYYNTGTLTSCTFTGGAALIAIADAGGYTTETTVEAALQQLYLQNLTAQGHVDIPLHAFREVDADGDVGNIAANGGILASDTTPVMEGGGTTFAQRILWATGNVDNISTSVSLPPDFNGAANCTVDLICASAGTTNDFDAVIVTNWDGGADVSDTVVDAAATAVHASSATIAAADIPDAPLCVSVSITPPTHATDIFYLYGVRIRYQKKLLTS